MHFIPLTLDKIFKNHVYKTNISIWETYGWVYSGILKKPRHDYIIVLNFLLSRMVNMDNINALSKFES